MSLVHRLSDQRIRDGCSPSSQTSLSVNRIPLSRKCLLWSSAGGVALLSPPPLCFGGLRRAAFAKSPACQPKLYRRMVEVAGIEPASEGLQLEETTCLAGPLSFAGAPFEPAGTTHRYPLIVSDAAQGRWQRPSLLMVASHRPRRQDRGNVTALSGQC